MPVGEMLTMGFSPLEIDTAMQTSSNNVEEAIDFLINNVSNGNTSDPTKPGITVTDDAESRKDAVTKLMKLMGEAEGCEDDDDNNAFCDHLSKPDRASQRTADGRTVHTTRVDDFPGLVETSLEASITGRKFFITARGYLGLGPRNTKVGDVVTIILGCHVPIILRRHMSLDSRLSWCLDHASPIDCLKEQCDVAKHAMVKDWWTVVGAAYLHGAMSGNNVEARKNGNSDPYMDFDLL